MIHKFLTGSVLSGCDQCIIRFVTHVLCHGSVLRCVMQAPGCCGALHPHSDTAIYCLHAFHYSPKSLPPPPPSLCMCSPLQMLLLTTKVMCAIKVCLAPGAKEGARVYVTCKVQDSQPLVIAVLRSGGCEMMALDLVYDEYTE